MCVAVYKPHDAEISEADLRACFVKNPDGAGFMYHDQAAKKVITSKGYFTFDAFYKAYLEHLAGPAKHTGMAIHFRIGTSGAKDETNCHPHIVADDFAFIHNGVMSEFAYAKSPLSDTAHFMDEILKPLYGSFGCEFLRKAKSFSMIEKYIGTYNKMLFMDGAGYYWIMNKSQWDNVGGVMFSNLHWRPVVTKPYQGTAATGAYRGGLYLEGKWLSWKEYRDKYPNKDGAFEKDFDTHNPNGIEEVKSTIVSRVTGEYYDKDLKRWVKGKPEDKKKDEVEKTTVTDGCGDDCSKAVVVKADIGSEVDELGNVIQPLTEEQKRAEAVAEQMEKINRTFGITADDSETFPDSRCINCKRDLEGEETLGSRMCITCEAWVSQAQGN